MKGSGVVFTHGEGISTPRVRHKGRQPLEAQKSGRKQTSFSAFFLENVMNSLSEHAALSEFISIH